MSDSYYNPAERKVRHKIAARLFEMARDEIFSGPKNVIIEIAIDVLRSVKSPETRHALPISLRNIK